MTWNPCHFYVGVLPQGCTGCLLCPNQIIKVDNHKGKELYHGSRVCSVYFCQLLPLKCSIPKENCKSVITPYGVNFFVHVKFLQKFSPRAVFFSKGVSKGESTLNISCLLCLLSYSLPEIHVRLTKNSETYGDCCDLLMVFFFFVDVIQGPC